MRYEIEYDGNRGTWAVVDTLSVMQVVGQHGDRHAALIQAESEERRWRLYGCIAESFAQPAY